MQLKNFFLLSKPQNTTLTEVLVVKNNHKTIHKHKIKNTKMNLPKNGEENRKPAKNQNLKVDGSRYKNDLFFDATKGTFLLMRFNSCQYSSFFVASGVTNLNYATLAQRDLYIEESVVNSFAPSAPSAERKRFVISLVHERYPKLLWKWISGSRQGERAALAYSWHRSKGRMN